MTLLLDREAPRTLDALLRDLSDGHHGAAVEAWLFEDEAARRETETTLASAGVSARLRSAYKPLLHAFLEEIETEGLAKAVICYPVHPAAVPDRFLLEAYPLKPLLDGVELRFKPGDERLCYRVALTYRDGRNSTTEVFAPNHLDTDHLDAPCLSPTGWLRVTGRPEGEPDLDERMETEVEGLFRAVVETVKAHPWGTDEPYFERLAITVEAPAIERALPFHEEAVSLHEALHEDLYFTLLEVFQRHSGRPAGDRRLQPGQIVPEIRAGAPRVRVETVPFDVSGEPGDWLAQAVETAEAPLSIEQVHRELAALGGQPILARSRQGRAVPGLIRPGSRPAVVVTGGQHANETTGPVGALRAAQLLLQDPEHHLALIPLENPDGYALHRRLCRDNPRHMHHAARYTALGDDLEYRSGDGLFERAARSEAIARTGAQLHVNLHGYPAHEWTRPFTGYLPRGFEMWTIPKGFFLVLRHHAGWEEPGMALIEAVTRRLARIEPLLELNRMQLAAYGAHAGAGPFTVINGIPCLIGPDERHVPPLTLITEYPDETIYGDRFSLGHQVQMETVLAAAEHHAGVVA
ncbi:peptidase M14 [Mycobacterium sp. KBS0706]|uniref:M14 family zinc carboxypeptidase n=1 Tax=Mycobacterium sp. KBS0706 TaxID=2578109 RepID=UPI00110F8FD8|nr:M14 family zinc carboxypeptidase [Mycobacterium sp. KBS0706]TSD87315.1 peptidase M14 [Mycobacterium sp. KBS0706]